MVSSAGRGQFYSTRLNIHIISSVTAGNHFLIFLWPLSNKQTINFSYITLSAREPSEYHMEKQELSFQFASVLDAKQQTGQ